MFVESYFLATDYHSRVASSEVVFTSEPCGKFVKFSIFESLAKVETPRIRMKLAKCLVPKIHKSLRGMKDFPTGNQEDLFFIGSLPPLRNPVLLN